MQTQVELAHDPEFQVGISMPPVERPARWNGALRFGFRFAFCYFILYFFPFPLGNIPYTEKVADWVELLWHKVVPWTAQHILRLSQPITIFTNGSGDTTLHRIDPKYLLTTRGFHWISEFPLNR